MTTVSRLLGAQDEGRTDTADAVGRRLSIVYTLDPAERVADAVRYVVQATAPAVILVLPDGRAWSEADFELLARRAADARRAVSIVSQNRRTRAAARVMGLAVFGTVAQAQRGGSRRPPAWPWQAVQRAARLRGAPARPSVRARRPAPLWLARLARLVVLLLTLVAGGGVVALALAALPTATITLRPAQRDVEVEFEAQARGGAAPDPAQGLFPARTLDVTVEEKLAVPATGQRAEPGERASGVVQLINRRAEPVAVPAGALVETSAGMRLRFRTTQPVELPAGVGTTMRVPVTAVEPGPESNVPAYAINTLEPSLALYAGVVNDAPLSGGTIRATPIVTDDDRRTARTTLLDSLRSQAVAALRAQLAPGERLAVASVEDTVLAERLDEDPIARPDQATLTLRIRATGLGYDPDQARPAAEAMLARNLPDGYKLLPRETRFAPGVEERVTRDDKGWRVWLPVRVRGRGVAALDPDTVRWTVRGLTPEEARQRLGDFDNLAEPAWVSLGSSGVAQWWQRLPLLPMRIEVVILGEAS